LRFYDSGLEATHKRLNNEHTAFLTAEEMQHPDSIANL
jgi:hypothetical protein